MDYFLHAETLIIDLLLVVSLVALAERRRLSRREKRSRCSSGRWSLQCGWAAITRQSSCQRPLARGLGSVQIPRGEELG